MESITARFEVLLRVHEIIILPGAGHLGTGTFERGHVQGSLAEVDLIDRYVTTLVEELDNSAIRHRVVTTRKAPGLSRAHTLKTVFPNSLVVECRIGWNDAKKVKAQNNLSAIACNADATPLAAELGQVMGHWGGLYVFGHRSARPEVEAMDDVGPSVGWIRLEPYQINAPHADCYAQWSHKLGFDLGRALADWCRRKTPDTCIKTQGFLQPRARHG